MTFERCLNPDCHRPLKDPASRRRGYGRTCWEARQPQPIGAIIRNLPMLRRGKGEPIPGQDEIDFEETP